jgi:negative regulator of sigma E activity
MSRRTSPRAACAAVAPLLGLLGLLGCDPEASGVSESLPNSISLVMETAAETGFVATRRYTVYGQNGVGEYVERFTRAPDGRTRADLLELNGATYPQITDPAELEQFEAMQEMMLLGRGRYIATRRDFSISSAAAFLANYTWLEFDDTQVVAGRPCLTAEVRPNYLDRPWYRVFVDAETGVTLKHVEHLPSGAVAATMETLTVDFSADLSNVVFPASPASTPQTIDFAQVPAAIASQAFRPTYLPAGFVLERAQVATIAGYAVVSFSYGDGVQQLTIAQYPELTPSPIQPPPGYTVDGPLMVRITASAAQVEARFVIGVTQIHVSGKLEPEELQTVVDSMEPFGD